MPWAHAVSAAFTLFSWTMRFTKCQMLSKCTWECTFIVKTKNLCGESSFSRFFPYKLLSVFHFLFIVSFLNDISSLFAVKPVLHLQVQGFTDSSTAGQIFWAGLALGQKIPKVINCKIRPELIQPQASIGRCLCSYFNNLFVKIKKKKNDNPLPTFNCMFTLGKLECWCKFSVWVCLATLTR